MRFGKKMDLGLRFIGPFEMLERIGELAYHLVFILGHLTIVIDLLFHLLEIKNLTSLDCGIYVGLWKLNIFILLFQLKIIPVSFNYSHTRIRKLYLV